MKHVIILPNAWAAMERRKAMTSASLNDSLDTVLTSSDLFLEEMWSTWGSGFALAGRFQRLAALSAAVEERLVLTSPSRGTVSLLFSFIDFALGSSRLDAFLERASGCLDMEKAVAECVVAYEKALASKGLIDPGRAYQTLAPLGVLPDTLTVSFEGLEPTLAQRDFFNQQSHVKIFHASVCKHADFRRNGQVEVDRILPIDRHAEPSSLVRFLIPRLSKGKAVVLTKRPLELFERIAYSFACAGARCFVKGTRSFAETHIGKAFLSVFDIVHSEGLQRNAVYDYLLNPVSLVPLEDAHELAAFIRGDRIIGKDAVLSELRRASKPFEYLEELACDPEADVLMGCLEDLLLSALRDEDSLLEEQIAALGKMRSVFSSARCFGVDAPGCKELLSHAAVDVSYEAGEGLFEVVILDWNDVFSLPPASCATVVACDMASADWPPDANQVGLLVEELLDGASCRRSSCVKELFFAAYAVSSDAFYVEWRQYDDDANPLYPLAIAEEALGECCLEAASCVMSGEVCIRVRGEYRLHEALSFGSGLLAQEEEKPSSPECAMGEMDLFAPARLSAAQIGSYVSCPRKWFTQYRLGLDTLDESFDSAREARFCREALALFYELFQDVEGPKVNAETLPAARLLMRDVVRECKDAHRLCSPEDARLVAASEGDEYRFAILLENLVSYLDIEASLLPSFTPLYFDYEIPADEASWYAGFALMGRIDRIDVDDAGRAVVVKYVSSLGSSQGLRNPDDCDLAAVSVDEIQVLVQAQFVRRYMGFNVVGALCVCHGRNGGIAGVLDRGVGCWSAPAAGPSNCVLQPEGDSAFARFLDDAERRIEEALLELRKGNVRPSPASDEACRYCPVVTCRRRRC